MLKSANEFTSLAAIRLGERSSESDLSEATNRALHAIVAPSPTLLRVVLFAIGRAHRLLLRSHRASWKSKWLSHTDKATVRWIG